MSMTVAHIAELTTVMDLEAALPNREVVGRKLNSIIDSTNTID